MSVKVWITKYALSSGIREEEAEICEDVNVEMIRVGKQVTMCSEYFHGEDWHRTREGAVARAEKMREKKIASLKKKIEKLTKASF
jgi:hypothetical protein